MSGSYGAMTLSVRSVLYTNLRKRRTQTPPARRAHRHIRPTPAPAYKFVSSSETAYYMVPVDQTAYHTQLDFSRQAPVRYATQEYDTETFRLVYSQDHDSTSSLVGFPVSNQKAFEAAMKKVKAAQ